MPHILGGNGNKGGLPGAFQGMKFRLPANMVHLMQKKQVGLVLLPPLRTAPAGPPRTAFMSAAAAKLLLAASNDAPAMITRVARAMYERHPETCGPQPVIWDDLPQRKREDLEEHAALAIMGSAPAPTTENPEEGS